jgi:peptidyl-prolyl cis-trans isomerase D
MQVVLALVLISFIGWTGTPQGDTTRVVATVNGERILTTDLDRGMREAVQRLEAMQQRTLSQDERMALSQDVRDRLVDEALVRQEALRIGLQVSDAEIAEQLVSSPAFQDRDGRYSAEMHDRFLKRTQFTRDDFNERIRDQILVDKMRTLVLLSASVSDATVRDYWREANTQITLDVVRVRLAAFDDDVDIDDATREAFLKDQAPRVREAYDRDFDRLYNHPEQIGVSLIRMALVEGGPTDADLLPRMNGLRAQIEGGADFRDLAARWSEDPSAATGGDLGLRPVVQFPLEATDILRDLQPGQLSRVVSSATDLRLYRVDQRVPARVETLDEVRVALADRLIRAEKVPGLAATWAEEQLLAQWKARGTVPQDLLDAQGLAVAVRGPMAATPEKPPFGLPSALVRAAGSAPVRSVLPEVYEERGDLYVASLSARTEPDPAAFEAEKASLREMVLFARREAVYTDWIASLRARAAIF